MTPPLGLIVRRKPLAGVRTFAPSPVKDWTKEVCGVYGDN